MNPESVLPLRCFDISMSNAIFYMNVLRTHIILVNVTCFKCFFFFFFG
jgi:hypothetical protein